MKKSAFFLFAAFLSFVMLAGCAEGETAPTGAAAEIADKIFAEAAVENFGFSQAIVNDSDLEYYLGSKDYPEFIDSMAVVPMINIDTRALVVIRAADKGDVEDIKIKLKENIDPNKVVCVTFSLEDVEIESRGDVILLTINSDAEQRSSLVEAFRNIE